MAAFECVNHPGADARWMCVGCESVFCGECVGRRRFGAASVDTCKACGELCQPMKAGRANDREALTETFLGAFAYPLRDAGPLMIAAGTLFSCGTLLFLRGLGGLLFVWCLFLGYGMQVLRETADGRENAPNWPDVNSAGQLFKPMLLAIATAFVSYAPAFWAFRSGHPWLGGALVLAGVAYAPMAWIAASISGNLLAITPVTVLPLLAKVRPSYFGACALLLGIYAVFDVATKAVVGALPTLVGYAFMNAAFLYLMMVEMRVLGLVWRSHADELGQG
ncbi:MAG: hypothetical protein ACQGVC_04930 [Myxococcota bacterium]